MQTDINSVSLLLACESIVYESALFLILILFTTTDGIPVPNELCLPLLCFGVMDGFPS